MLTRPPAVKCSTSDAVKGPPAPAGLWLLLASAVVGCSEPTPPSVANLVAPSPMASLRAAYVTAVQRDADPSYQAFSEAASGLRFDSAAQQLVTRLTSQSVQVEHRSGARVDFALRTIDCARSETATENVAPSAHGNRVEYARPGLREWYVNGPLGVEQGFVIEAPARRASCAGHLALRVELSGKLRPVLAADRSYIELRTDAGQPVMRYQDLYAQDATGRALPTGLALNGTQVELLVDDSAATYPITVDPLLRWVEQQKLIASDTATNAYLGASVAVSGDTAVLGATGLTVMGKASAGGAYVFVRTGMSWTEQAKLTSTDRDANALGDAIALSGDTVVLGGRFVDVAGKVYAGAAYVFVRSGTTWAQQAKLANPVPVALDYFGTSVAVSGDTVLVGSPRTEAAGKSDAGVAYVFVRSGTTWTKQAELLAGDIGIQGNFGNAVALNGDEAVIGAPWQSGPGRRLRSGEVYLFSRSGTTWTQTASLQASDGATDDHLGDSVAFSGNVLIAGAPEADLPGSKLDAGAAYLFTRSGMTWTQTAKLTAPDAALGDAFGTSVAATTDTVAISAPKADLMGKANAGAAYLFVNNAGTWDFVSKVVASDSIAGMLFGQALALQGNTLIAGASLAAASGKTNAGAGYFFAAIPAKTDGSTCSEASDCQSNFCIDGVCCNTACGDGALTDCEACSVARGAASDGTCAAVKAGNSCRAAVGGCDEAEVCDGTARTCPANRFKASGTACRPALGDCDIAETCDGTSAVCPMDQVKSAGSVCRPSAGACDYAEVCSGFALFKNCPPDDVKSAGTVCRPSAGVCDVAESCTGTAAACPTDDFVPTTKECRTAVGVCDAAEFCSGTAAACPPDTAKPATTLCRPAIGDCDAPEFCTGSANNCPMDALASSTTVCRPAASACDVAETCSGLSIVCPPDVQQGMCKTESDVSITLSASPSQLAAPGETTLSALVRASGPSPTTGVALRLDLPAGVEFVRAEGEKWTCAPALSSVACARTELAAGQVAPLQLVLRITIASSQFTLSATVLSALFDPVPTNNTSTVTISTLLATGGCSVSASPRTPVSPVSLLLLGTLLMLRRRAPRAANRT